MARGEISGRDRRRNGVLAATTVALASGALACGDGTTASAPGEVAGVFLDDPSTRVAAVPGAGFHLAHHKAFGPKYYHGTMSGEVQVLLSTDGRAFVPLAPGRRASVALQDTDAETAVHPVGRAPAGTYRHVRLVIGEATVEVTAGSVLDGRELETREALALAGQEGLVVDLALPAPLEVTAGRGVTLVIDLNSEVWVSAEGVEEGRVDPEVFAGAVSVGVRLGVVGGAATAL